MSCSRIQRASTSVWCSRSSKYIQNPSLPSWPSGLLRMMRVGVSRASCLPLGIRWDGREAAPGHSLQCHGDLCGRAGGVRDERSTRIRAHNSSPSVSWAVADLLGIVGVGATANTQQRGARLQESFMESFSGFFVGVSVVCVTLCVRACRVEDTRVSSVAHALC
jgi:hypothetical protein